MMQNKIETIIKACRNWLSTHDEHDYISLAYVAIKELLDALTEQEMEPVAPFKKDDHHYYCGVCGLRLSSKKQQRHCHGCGRAVDWDG